MPWKQVPKGGNFILEFSYSPLLCLSSYSRGYTVLRGRLWCEPTFLSRNSRHGKLVDKKNFPEVAGSIWWMFCLCRRVHVESKKGEQYIYTAYWLFLNFPDLGKHYSNLYQCPLFSLPAGIIAATSINVYYQKPVPDNVPMDGGGW